MPQNPHCTSAGWLVAMPTLVDHLGMVARQLMEELANYIHRSPSRDSSGLWKNGQVWR